MIDLKPKTESKFNKNSGRLISFFKKSKNLYIVIGLIFLLIVSVFVAYFPSSKTLMKHALAGKDYLYEAQQSVTEGQYLIAKEKLELAQIELNNALNELDKMGSLRKLPYAKTQVSAIENLLKAGIQTAAALEKIAQLADEIITPIKTNDDFNLAQLTIEQKHELLKKISESLPDVIGVKAEIDLAVLHFNQIPEKGILPQLKKAIEPLKEQLPILQDTIAQVIPAVEILPPIAGYPEEQTYLFLLENNAELRPTGGFIGTYGILKVKDAEITSFHTDNIYNIDNPVKDRLIELPPEPLRKYLNADKWFMRDSNWSPDFPTSAEKAIWFYHQEDGPEKNIHGVIAITPNIIESLLGLTGEIKIDGINFTKENFAETLQYQVEQGYYRQGISDDDRKEVIGELADELLNRIMSFPQSRWGELWQTVQNHIEEKQILLYSKNESLQYMIEQENWGGQMYEENQGDYLMIVDANMASLKSDPGVNRKIDYKINKTAEGLIADLTITYENTGTFDWKSTRYRTYTRVYIPEGAELIEHSGVMENDKLHGGRQADPEVYNELGKTVIGGFISIEPQETGSLNYKYKLPSSVINNDNEKYRLYVQKQPGAKPHNLNLYFEFNEKILYAEPIDKAELKDDNSMTLSTDLRNDKIIEITFE